jgi:DNA polymerase III epsilon subunit-like protein
MSLHRNAPKIVFIDTEFTGEHAYATLVSLGLVTLEGKELYITLNDYDKNQVTDWLAENVLIHIDSENSVDSASAYGILHSFLSEYSDGSPLYVVSCGLLQDYLLMLELYKYSQPERRYFHALHCLPDYLNHYAAIDLNTLFRVCSIDPAINRAEFAGFEDTITRHNALDDAKVVRGCFLKIQNEPAVINLMQRLSR